MPPVIYDLLNILGFAVRVGGMIVLGVAFSFFTVEFFKKGQQVWMVQVAIFLGFIGLVIALSTFTSPGALGAFALGAGGGLLYKLAMPKGEKKDEEEKE
jgi:membrane protein DedA with SNARE-associated domain